MISDLDRPGPGSERRPAWPLPVVTALCVLAFIGVAVGTTGPLMRGTASPEVAARPAVNAPPSAVLVIQDPPPAGVPPRHLVAPTSAGLGLPPGSYKSVTRIANAVTTGLYPADEEALVQLRYRLADDRVAVLVRLPRSDPLRGIEPASYTAGSLVVRGIDARVLTGRSAVEPTILLWTEGTRAYQLYSSVHSLAELAQLAEQLR